MPPLFRKTLAGISKLLLKRLSLRFRKQTGEKVLRLEFTAN
jgi:hypothetical protein